MFILRRICLVGCFVLLTSISLAEEKWGTLSGRFIFDGEIPVRKRIPIDKDIEAFNKPLFDESLIVNEKNKGIANVVIYLRTKNPVVHPFYKKEREKSVELFLENGRFTDHILLIHLDQTLKQSNLDTVGHNVNIQPVLDVSSWPLLPAGTDSVEFKFNREQRMPISVSCNIHPWMNSYILPRSNPYMAVTDEDGEFEIKNLPAGDLEFQLWHEKPGYLQKVSFESETVKSKFDERGRVIITIKEGENNLGDIIVNSEQFKDWDFVNNIVNQKSHFRVWE